VETQRGRARAAGRGDVRAVVGAALVCAACLAGPAGRGGSTTRWMAIAAAACGVPVLVLRRRAANARLSARATSAFFGAVSPDIRSRASRLVDVALAAGPSGRDGVRRAGEALVALVDRIDELCRIEAGAVAIASAPVAARDVVADVMESFAGRAQAKGVELAYHVDAAVPPTAHGDATHLRKVLGTLVDNAVEYTRDGEVVVRVRAGDGGSRSVVLHVEVADTGVGIPAAERALLFRPFARPGTGTGLGLPIAARLVALMGGEIGVESEPGSGTTAWFTVRLGRDVGAVVVPEEPGLRGLRALVVDARIATRAIVEQQLRSWRMRSNGAADPATAVARLRAGMEQGDPYAVVVADAGAPEAGGLELARALAVDGALAGVPVVLLAPPALRDSAPPNVVATLAKPVREERLRAALVDVARAAVSAGRSGRRSSRASGS
jgi:two-component system sensor histidine kinase/response regulator